MNKKQEELQKKEGKKKPSIKIVAIIAIIIFIILLFLFFLPRPKYTSEKFVQDLAVIAPREIQETVPEFEQIISLQEPDEIILAIYGGVAPESKQETDYKAMWYSTTGSKIIVLSFDSQDNAKNTFDAILGKFSETMNCNKLQYEKSYKCEGKTVVYVWLKDKLVINLEK